MTECVEDAETDCQLRVGEIARQRAEWEYLTERLEAQGSLLSGLSEERSRSRFDRARASDAIIIEVPLPQSPIQE